MAGSPDIRPYVLSPLNAGLFVRDGRVVYPDGVAPRKKVVIYGCGGASRYRVPFDSDEFVIYAINNFWNDARDSQDRLRADVWWEQHQITPDESGPEAGLVIQNENDMRWINTCPVPLYTTQPWPANPNAVVWDIEFFASHFGRDYFTCTFAMQLAQAIYEGFEEIHVFGLALLNGTKREATVESSCVAYWLGLAEGRGIKVVTPKDELLLLHPYRYGHQYWLERRFVEQYCARWDRRPVAV